VTAGGVRQVERAGQQRGLSDEQFLELFRGNEQHLPPGGGGWS
jgi:hypothetical protein